MTKPGAPCWTMTFRYRGNWVPDVTENAFLGGKIMIRQPLNGYRAGVDPVLLAASVPAVSGQTVLELGCGVGTASLCLGNRVPGLIITGIECQSEYADLAQQNVDLNGQNMTVVVADIEALPLDVRQCRYDHVIVNPPYFDRKSSTAAQDAGRETALGEVTTLAAWVDIAARRLAPKGFASFIHRAERLPELLDFVSQRLGSIQVLPLIPREGRDANLVIVRARKGGRAGFRLHSGLVLHEGDKHEGDRENYRREVRAVLRDGAKLGFPD